MERHPTCARARDPEQLRDWDGAEGSVGGSEQHRREGSLIAAAALQTDPGRRLLGRDPGSWKVGCLLVRSDL